jgi:hypothetical protein
MEFLVSDDAQRLFAAGTKEWPVVETVPHAEVLDVLYGDFVEDDLNPAIYGANRVEALELMETHAWK